MGNGATPRFQARSALACRLLYRESITAPTTPGNAMPTPMPENTEFEAIEPSSLETVAGGAARVSASSSNDQLTAMLTQITSSISDLAKNNQQQTDPMQMMLMMMMMGGMGGGGGGGYAAAPLGTPPVINVDTGVSGGGGGGFCHRGKKGW